MRIRIGSRAQRDIEGQINYLASRAPDAAERALGRLFGAIRAVREFPEMGRPVAPPFREMVVRFGQFGFIVRYRVVEQAVVIERVFHGSQDRGQP